MNDKTMLLLSLQQGLGFTQACEVSGNDPKEASKEVQKDKALRGELEGALRAFKVNALVEANDYAKKEKYQKAEEARNKAVNGPSLVLWGDGLIELQKVNPEAVIATYLRIRNPKDVATSLGFTYREYVEYIAANEAIAIHIRVILPEETII